MNAIIEVMNIHKRKHVIVLARPFNHDCKLLYVLGASLVL